MALAIEEHDDLRLESLEPGDFGFSESVFLSRSIPVQPVSTSESYSLGEELLIYMTGTYAIDLPGASPTASDAKVANWPGGWGDNANPWAVELLIPSGLYLGAWYGTSDSGDTWVPYAFSPSHTYLIPYTGQGTPLTFTYTTGIVNPQPGGITVSVYRQQ